VSPLVRALRRYLRSRGKIPRSAARALTQASGVAETRISEVLHGKRARFSVADAARLTVVTEMPLEILLGLDLKRVTCPACGWSVLRRRGTRFALARHQWLCPRAVRQ
jgi:hypothetical protein